MNLGAGPALLACALLLWAGVAGPALAQDPQQLEMRGSGGSPVAPVPPAEQPAPKPAIRVAKEINASMSIDLTARVGSAVEVLYEKLVSALNAKKVDAEPVQSPDGKYVPPGDDEIALSDAGIGADEMRDRIGSGYPNSAGPMALMTVAERGGYVIAAAYMFSDDNGKKALKRVSRIRVPAASVDQSTVENVWPACFADAIERHVRSLPAPGEDPKCQSRESRAPAQQHPQQRAASAQTKSSGMLDDIPAGLVAIDSKTGMVTVGPPTPKKGAVPPKPVTPAQTATAPAVVPPAPPATLPPPLLISPPIAVPPPPGQATSNDSGKPNVQFPPKPGRGQQDDQIASLLSSSVSSVSGYQLWEQIYAYGFVWRPSETSRIHGHIRAMWDRKDVVGECLNERKEQFGGERPLLNMMTEEFRDGQRHTAVKKMIGTNLHQITPVPPPLIPRTPRGCVAPKPLSSFTYSVRKVDLPFARVVNELAKLNDEDHRAWRMPTALEVFAIATALIYSDDVDQNQLPLSFWTDRDQGGIPGIVTISRGLGVDYQGQKSEDAMARLLVIQQ